MVLADVALRGTHGLSLSFSITFLGPVIMFYCSLYIFFHLTQSDAAFSALRVFALTGRNWFLALVFFVLSLAPLIINFVRNSPLRVVIHNHSSSCRWPFSG